MRLVIPIPNRPLFWLCGSWLVLGILSVIFPGGAMFWQAAALMLAALGLADAWAGYRARGQIQLEREVGKILPVGTWQTVFLKMQGAGTRVSGWVYDQHPAVFRTEDQPLAFELRASQWIRLEYRILTTERGDHVFHSTRLRLYSPLRLWLIPETLQVRSEIRVFPNFSRIVQYSLLATDHRLSQIGILQRRRRGEGMEFHQLRDYRQDDAPRQIDWKATARAGKLVSREYQDERDQQIVFLLDCGVRMRAHDGELSHFDHTLNALLLLAYVALRQGDAVGLASFGHATPRYLPPRKAVTTVHELLQGTYDLQPGLEAPDYLVAADILQKRLRKRALVILVTNLRDEDDSTLMAAMTLLRQRHAVTLVSLKEPVLEEVLHEPVSAFEQALTRVAALDYLKARQQQAGLLRHQGVHILDSSPRELPPLLVNHYWARKRAGSI